MLNTLNAPSSYSNIAKRRLAKAGAPAGGKGEHDDPPRVLLVEDTPDVRKLIKFILEDTGMQVTALGDGQSASEMIDNWPAPDLVVMDRMLPFISGDDLIKRIRSDETWAEVPVIVVSAKARGDQVAESLMEGADDYVTKPFNPSHLIEVVGRYI